MYNGMYDEHKAECMKYGNYNGMHAVWELLWNPCSMEIIMETWQSVCIMKCIMGTWQTVF